MLEQSDYPIYFAFPDGALHYVCSECDALCCRGHGFAGSVRREMKSLFRVFPALEAAVTGRKGDLVQVANPSGGCYFLGTDRRCRIEEEHGRAMKPGVCLLFPFNRLFRLGETIVVSPHFLCPLRLQVPPQPGQVEGTHALLEIAVRESGLGEIALTREGHDLTLSPLATPEEVVREECDFRERCGAALGRETFRTVLAASSPNPDYLLDASSRASKLLELDDVDAALPPDLLDATLLALAPALRLSLLSLPSDGRLLALAVAERLIRRLWSLDSVTPTVQKVHSVVSNRMPALRLLARADEPVLFPPTSTQKSPPFGDPVLTLAALTILRSGSGSCCCGTLELLEHAFRPVAAVSDRIAVLNRLGELLDSPLH
jgi:hypothetical protein